MITPDDRRYSTEHEWALEEEEVVRVGITAYAQDQLGDIVFLDIPEAGSELEASKPCGELESVKSVSDLYSPVSGNVVRVNQEVIEDPELANLEPYERGWLMEIEAWDLSELDRLLTAKGYDAFIEE